MQNKLSDMVEVKIDISRSAYLKGNLLNFM